MSCCASLRRTRTRSPRCPPSALVISFLRPLDRPELIQALAARGVSALAMELVPRITRAQTMDALSSQANIAGYRAVLVASTHLPRYFPLLMTAAGTVPPAKVLVLGAGVAGLQAIATARRLGAVVSAFDVRPGRARAGGEPRREVPRGRAGRGRRERRRVRQGALGGHAAPPARAPGRARRGQRRRHHHRARPRQAGAQADRRRHGRARCARAP